MRRIYCNRTLNMRSIRAIGYDMDYTLVHYRVEEWERRAYDFLKQRLLKRGWPVQKLSFDPMLVCRGLVVDLERGNLVKANRFGFIKRAMHGTKILDFEAQRDAYSRTIVDLSEDRWIFLNTLFSLSEGCMYAQVIDLLDAKLIPETLGYRELYKLLKHEVDTAHMEGQLKAAIIADPDRFVILDEETALALLDQHHSGKKLLLITNSEWTYTSAMMSYAFDRFLPKGQGMSWRKLFNVIIVGARKPDFFRGRSPLFEVVTEDGLLQPVTTRMTDGKAYLGGSAADVESHLGLSGDEILYVGDHMFGDVKVTKDVLRWRTALVLRELEDEIEALTQFKSRESQLAVLMEKKEALEDELCQVRLKLQRIRLKYGPPVKEKEADLQKRAEELRGQHSKLDDQIGPLAKASAELNNPLWGLLMRAGNDKSHLAYQVERYADIYTSRVSNLLAATPFVYLRSTRGTLPHDLSGPYYEP